MYFTSVYRSDQDVVETLCVIDNVLAQMKTDYPNLKGLYRKSDNANCYADNSCAEVEHHYARNTLSICVNMTIMNHKKEKTRQIGKVLSQKIHEQIR